MGHFALTDAIQHACKKFLSGKWKALFNAAERAAAKPPRHITSRDDDETLERKCELAQELAQKGNLSKAAQALPTKELIINRDPLT